MGRPLMPPLSLTQAKYAFVSDVIQVKSAWGDLVAMAPSLMGSPVAFCPVPMPHSPGFWMLLAVPPPEAAVVAPPPAVVAEPSVVAAAVVAAASVPAGAAVVSDDDLLSEPHPTTTSALAATMPNNERFMRPPPRIQRGWSPAEPVVPHTP